MTEQPLKKENGPRARSPYGVSRARTGTPILFLHGNPTSSYIWRNVLPALEGHGRLIVPNLVGMGDSERLPDVLPDSYRFTTHRDYLWAFIDAVTSPHESILIVGHDWGAALGFEWAMRHPGRVRGIAYMEAIVRPFTLADGSSELGPTFMALRRTKEKL